MRGYMRLAVPVQNRGIDPNPSYFDGLDGATVMLARTEIKGIWACEFLAKAVPPMQLEVCAREAGRTQRIGVVSLGFGQAGLYMVFSLFDWFLVPYSLRRLSVGWEDPDYPSIHPPCVSSRILTVSLYLS